MSSSDSDDDRDDAASVASAFSDAIDGDPIVLDDDEDADVPDPDPAVVEAPAGVVSEMDEPEPLPRDAHAWRHHVKDPSLGQPQARNANGRFDFGFKKPEDMALFSTPLQSFLALFPEDLIHHIVERTNPYLHAKGDDPTDVPELKRWLAMLIIFGIKKQTNIRSAFSTQYTGAYTSNTRCNVCTSALPIHVFRDVV